MGVEALPLHPQGHVRVLVVEEQGSDVLGQEVDVLNLRWQEGVKASQDRQGTRRPGDPDDSLTSPALEPWLSPDGCCPEAGGVLKGWWLDIPPAEEPGGRRDSTRRPREPDLSLDGLWLCCQCRSHSLLLRTCHLRVLEAILMTSSEGKRGQRRKWQARDKKRDQWEN